MNIGARLIPSKNRSAYLAAQKARTDHGAARTKLGDAKTEAQKKAAENAIIRAQSAHHKAMGRLPIYLQVGLALKDK